MKSVYLVGKRPPLSEQPRLWQWLARFVYQQIGWAPEFGIEYIGIYAEEAAARYAANGPGLFYMELPLNGSLPEGACQYGVHDFPYSEASPEYRKRKLPFVAVPRTVWESERELARVLEAKTDELGECLEGKCAGLT